MANRVHAEDIDNSAGVTCRLGSVVVVDPEESNLKIGISHVGIQIIRRGLLVIEISDRDILAPENFRLSGESCGFPESWSTVVNVRLAGSTVMTFKVDPLAFVEESQLN